MRFTLLPVLAIGALTHQVTGTPVPSHAYAVGVACLEPNFGGEAMPLWLEGRFLCTNIASSTMYKNISSVAMSDKYSACQFFTVPDCPDSFERWEALGDLKYPAVPAQFDNTITSVACAAKTKKSTRGVQVEYPLQDEYAAHLYMGQNLSGDKLDIPVGNTCINLSDMFGDNAVRSLVVVKGNKCGFYELQRRWLRVWRGCQEHA
ncbi:uncharacterized protein BDZ99DRAFT_577245 [Mytilinidion resinicola]|uniref:Ecp2 effector protein domain-containing protein n=1 Tax=Mytilinidion resinicola TaxID=574789 RepID=A0A6A6Y205_9PEZI|nr:uncharacterized protein BDZ99DRAFT_577245 [Mytilinidion resinicola]KAF2802034.1 hypothetical protein BDZ99DRAFT_577245 [Mytilinidion resinicola]